MSQPDLFPDLYRVPVLPVAGKTPIARESSTSGAQQARKSLTEKQLAILGTLTIAGPLSRQQLCERTGISINAMCSSLQNLEDRGLVQRTGQTVTKCWPDGGT